MNADQDARKTPPDSPGSGGGSGGGGSSALAWPPPGLERVHSDLAPTVRRLAVGGTALVFPLLWAIGTPQQPWSPGRFGLDWWIVAAVALHGTALLASGWYALFRLARRTATALDRGYGWITIALVTTDVAHDAGFVLQGSRAYSTLDSMERRHLLATRVLAAAGFALAAGLIPLAFAAAVLLAISGMLGMTGLWIVSLGPSLLLLLLATMARAAEGTLTRKARKAWYKRPWSADLEQGEVERWKQALEGLDGVAALSPGRSGGGRALRLAATACLITVLAALLPPAALIGMSSVSSILAQIVTPSFSPSIVRSASVEPLREFVLEPDPAVTPLLAGEALHALSFVGRSAGVGPNERPPVRLYERSWLEEGVPASDARRLHGETMDLIRQAGSGLGPGDLRLLEEVADHPAHAEFELLARAAALDGAGGNLPMPLPKELGIMDLPIPRLSGVRTGAHIHLAKAALELAEGRSDRAETGIREVISVGLLLSDDGYTLIQNLVGQIVAELGGEALATFFEVTGREPDGAALRAAREAAKTAGARIAAVSARPDPGAQLAQLPRLVSDAELPRGLRWELFINYNTLGPCTNMHRIVFGPDPLHARWIEDSRASLVRFESESELFELASKGWFPTDLRGETDGVVGRVLGLPLVRNGISGSCGRVFSVFDGVL